MVYTDWRTPDNLSSTGYFFRALPPPSLCIEAKQAEMETKRLAENYIDSTYIIPINLQAPYRR